MATTHLTGDPDRHHTDDLALRFELALTMLETALTDAAAYRTMAQVALEQLAISHARTTRLQHTVAQLRTAYRSAKAVRA